MKRHDFDDLAAFVILVRALTLALIATDEDMAEKILDVAWQKPQRAE